MSELEEILAFQIKAKGLPKPDREFYAIPGRRFRFDFAWPIERVLVEVQGGTWGTGAHSTGKGISRDCEKHNLAVIEGWRCLDVTTDQIRSGKALRWIEETLRSVA